MTHITRALALVSLLYLHTYSHSPQAAICIVPVADLLGESLAAINKKNGTHLTYQTLALCGKPVGTYACPRIHQLLFHEIVEIVEEKNGEVMIKIPNLFFVTAEGKNHVTYWTDKKYVVSLATLETRGVDCSVLPQPISASNKNAFFDPLPHIVTLTHPYHDPTTQLTFSAGTRFVRAENQDDHILVYVLHPRQMRIKKITIPRAVCFDNATTQTEQEKIKKFVDTLRSWAHIEHGFIPYVWGGCSFVHTAHNNTYKEQAVYGRDKKIVGTVWVLEDYTWPIKTGFDCAGLISRAAQICGIPYFFKNSATVAQSLAERPAHELPKSGDIIWVPMHVMVVGDVKKNTIIEARIYSHGYGKVHEIPLHKAFKDIHTFAQLKQTVAAHKSLQRLGADGSVVQTTQQCKILNIESAWRP